MIFFDRPVDMTEAFDSRFSLAAGAFRAEARGYR